MKASELMVEDWVDFRTNVEHCYTKVHDGRHLWANATEFFPIPLTEDILKANGFILKQIIFGLAWWREEWVFKCSENKVIYITDGNGHRNDILYVHELQHALRLFGLNALADNFKVD